jgi:hypothetical protein
MKYETVTMIQNLKTPPNKKIDKKLFNVIIKIGYFITNAENAKSIAKF